MAAPVGSTTVPLMLPRPWANAPDWIQNQIAHIMMKRRIGKRYLFTLLNLLTLLSLIS
jgi:hypothetical protein